jgi:hypothetical protein
MSGRNGCDLTIRDAYRVTGGAGPGDQHNEEAGSPSIENQCPPFPKRVYDLAYPRLQSRPAQTDRHQFDAE